MSNLRQLPVIEGSLGRDGTRKRPYPADVKGRFAKARKVVFAVLIALWAALPWIKIGGHPAVFLDVMRRQFFLFGLTFNAQDAWLLFFMLSGTGFALLCATAILGRVWCGWACPQTVFLEGVFRPIERLVNGPRNVAMRRAEEPFGWNRAWRVAVTHGAYAVAAVLVAHVFLAYFVSLPMVYQMVRAAPSAHPEAFVWMVVVTGVFYGNFAFFREQLCVVICPYGRLQSVLIDDDSIVVGYDEKRGEPRGKASAPHAAKVSVARDATGGLLTAKDGALPSGDAARGAIAPTVEPAKGDCVDCNRCVVVCPTGIDIRHGLQLDCVACTACIDACDEVMDRLERPRGLVRYDSLRGLRGEKRRFFRPRIAVYGVLLVVGVVVASFALRSREPFEANLVRLPGAPYTRESGTIRNAFELHLVNKESARLTYDITATAPGLSFLIPLTHVEVDPLGSVRVPVFVTADQATFDGDKPFVVEVRSSDAKARVHVAQGQFLGSRQ